MGFVFETQKQVQIFAISLVFSLIAISAVVLRLVSRRVKGMRLAANDYLIICALVTCLGEAICNLIGLFAGGWGRHPKDITFEEDRTGRLVMFPITIIWAVSLGCVKTSLCFLYISIFPTPKFKRASYIVMVGSVVFALITILGNVLICLPVRALWDVEIRATCGNRNADWVAIGVLNIFTDILVVGLPIFMVWGLQIQKEKKFALSFIFGLGSLVCIISMIRLKFLLDVQFVTDYSYTVVDAASWSFLEPSLGISVACLPTLGPLFTKCLGSRNDRSSYNAKPGLRTFGGSNQKRKYHRTDDSLMLTRTSITGLHDKNLAGTYVTESNPDLEEGQRNDGIHVRSEWDVRHN